jgi:hypothetical protein
MIVQFCIQVDGIDFRSVDAVAAVDRLERFLSTELDHSGHRWWVNVEGGETRYAPDEREH